MSCFAPMTLARNARPGPRIAPPESETERQADRIADDVIAGRPVSLPAGGGGPGQGGTIHRQCAACAAGGPACASCGGEEDQRVLHLSPGPGATLAGVGAARAADALNTGGMPMPGGLRSYFEPRLGTDLSGVRLHRDEPAARGIGARAYTLGQNIAFAPGAYAPATRGGQRLIAHEIAHTLQADGQIHRNDDDDDEEETLPAPSAPATRTDTFEDTSGGGSTSFIDTVDTAPTRSGNVISGTVRRREIAPAGGGRAREDISSPSATPPGMTAAVEFDAGACEIRLPYRFGFQVAANDPRGNSCQDTAVDAADVDVNDIATRYVNAVNEVMNDQFTISLSGCAHDCADRDIPIRVVASRNDGSADRTISVVTRGGRGDASTLCAGSFETGFAVHEAGHQILGRGDEYRERDTATLARVPHWGRPERVRHDFNLMGSHYSFGRFAMFHERDFRHVQTFMNAALPGCNAALESTSLGPLDFRLYALGGGGLLGDQGALTAGGGFDVGIPLTRGREWSLIVGAQANYLGQVTGEQRRLVLAGLRTGVEAQVHGSGFSGRFFAGSRFGVSHELGTEPSTFSPDPGRAFDPRTSAFGEAQLGVGITGHLGSGGLSADLLVSGGGELSTHPDALYWFNVGLMLGGRF